MFIPWAAVAALPDVMLCDNGFPIVVSGDGDDDIILGCQSYAKEKCANGYSQRVIYGFGGLNVNAACDSGIKFQRHSMYIPNGMVGGLCHNAFPLTSSNGDDGKFVYECQINIQGSCGAGTTKQEICNFSPRTSDGACVSGMSVHAKGAYVQIETSGVTICDNGYFNGSTCVAYSENIEICPMGYRDVFDTDSIRLLPDGADCPTGATVLGAYDGAHDEDENQIYIWSYPYANTPDNMIALRMCSVGYEMNYLGNCVALCSVPGVRYLRTDTGVVMPVYNSKLTTPSINIRVGTSKVCYVNLQPESSTGAVNIEYNDVLYHTVN